ncbi:MAG: heparan-alpha-glucosaminide N-acetyltransferase [Pseudomonadota bacterium]
MRYLRGVPPAAETAAPLRHERLDALRGFAVVWMALFHFCFDLAHFRVIDADFYRDPLWTTQRTVIVSLFLFCAGLGQAIAAEQGQRWARFWRRWGQVAGCALLVSAGSALMFPRNWVSFGVLHGLALMLIVGRLSAGWGRWLWPLGLAALLLPQFVRHPWFDSRWTDWVGLVTHKPVTVDWVPLLPWLGELWWGLAAGQWLLQRRRGWLTDALPATCRPLVLLGRWSLSFYMLHQPVLIGALLAWQALR